MKSFLKLLIIVPSLLLVSCMPKDDLYIGKTSVNFGKNVVNHADIESYPDIKVLDTRKVYTKNLGKKIYGKNEIRIISHQELSHIIKEAIKSFYVNSDISAPKNIVATIEEFNYVSKRGFPLSETKGSIRLSLRIDYNKTHKIGSSIDNKHFIISSKAADKENIADLINKALEQL